MQKDRGIIPAFSKTPTDMQILSQPPANPISGWRQRAPLGLHVHLTIASKWRAMRLAPLPNDNRYTTPEPTLRVDETSCKNQNRERGRVGGKRVERPGCLTHSLLVA